MEQITIRIKDKAKAQKLMDLLSVLDFIESIETDDVHSAATQGQRPRVAGLHKGAIWISDDFDEPLDDAFWLGEL